MALTKNMAYDHPAYTTVHVAGAANTAGANSVQNRFAAFTSLIVKSFTATTFVQGTSASTTTLTLVKTQGTNTSTLCVTTMGTSSGIGATTNVLATASLVNAGDVVWIQAGADATGVWATGIEYVIQPGASVTP